jgi:hypothetical protein
LASFVYLLLCAGVAAGSYSDDDVKKSKISGKKSKYVSRLR